ncbi:MAG: DUF721 domain-containing protein [Armatimonadetes bacterium]|nr:MAG: DUF721 domain-containing protein [Armatimonadota bacterium]
MRAKYLGSGEGKQPKEISQLLGSIIEKAAVGVDVRHGQLVNDWLTVAPPDWAAFGTPVGVRDKTLLVEVSDGSAASLLKYQIGELKRAIEDRFGGDLVRSVKVRVRQA